MNASLMSLAAAAALLPLGQPRAGVDEPRTAPTELRRTVPSTALDDAGVRPLDRSRKPVPAIEQDVVLPEPRPPRRTRSADDEVVRPGVNAFRPERALDDALAPPKKPAGTQKAAPPSMRDRDRRSRIAEDPAGRAYESGRPTREGRVEQ